MNKLPEEYLEKMKELLKDEYDDYLQSFEEERVYGLRVNTAKICRLVLSAGTKCHVAGRSIAH